MQIEITVHSVLTAVRDDWLALQAGGVTTLYQTYEWCNAWHEAIGRPAGVEAQIVVGRDADGKVLFILPLALRQHGSFQIVEWLGSRITTYGLGVYDADFFTQPGKGMEPYWNSVLSALPPVDGVWLNHLPGTWHGVSHPMNAFFTNKSANQTHQIKLMASYDDLYAAKRSSNSRRRAHRRDRQLSAVGEVAFGLPASQVDGERLIDEMIAQHGRYLAARGVHSVLENGTADFLKRLSSLDADSQVSFFPQYLHVDGRLVAAKLGFIFDRVYWAMISSLGAGRLCITQDD